MWLKKNFFYVLEREKLDILECVFVWNGYGGLVLGLIFIIIYIFVVLRDVCYIYLCVCELLIFYYNN